jgi:two-component system response regulator CpxR
MHTGSRSVVVGGKPIAMTSTEYSVLEVLLREAGHVVSKGELSERALGRQLTRYDRSIDMHLSSLRKKLGPLPNGTERIKTVRGVGYQYTSP